MNKKNIRLKIQLIFAMLFLGLFFMMELYIMINYPEEYLLLAGLGVFVLLCLYIIVYSVVGMREQKDLRREEQYDSIFKSEKASYLMLKKYFEEFEDKLNELEGNSKSPEKEIISAQKAIAKVIMKHEKENIESLEDSYKGFQKDIEMLNNEIQIIKESISEYKNSIMDIQENIESSNERSLQSHLQELTAVIKDMELQLKKSVTDSNTKDILPDTEEGLYPDVADMEESKDDSEDMPKLENDAELPLEDEIGMEPEINVGEELQDHDLGENILDSMEEDDMETEPDFDLGDDIDISADLNFDKDVTTKKESDPEAGKPDDPNKMMNPDDIAALIASMGNNNG